MSGQRMSQVKRSMCAGESVNISFFAINNKRTKMIQRTEVNKIKIYVQYKNVWWCAGQSLDLRSFRSGFVAICVKTLGKLFTPMCLCHQVV